MSLETASQANLKIILDQLADYLNVVNRGLLDADDYDLNKYDELKSMYDMVVKKGRLSSSEAQAFIEELANIRKR
ncbi:DUF1128 domain-containing protein [Oceanobacillus piezotolerans]|uniref:DUF1128 domain-containing protein n=1 Tax=Oceanobacillus piezotolerans TaxID=2448030 RepID=A0A498D905_9BACI|nr:DUF1128 domain-containing protein [Oceanobacillus piezotolerans]RLL45287.1 DUF1128 domain-containing protein [Oceanobacillus piezotolerans]